MDRGTSLLLAALLAAAACTSSATQRVDPAAGAPPTETVDGLRQRAIRGEGAVFVVDPAPDWSRFGRILVEAPRIDYAAHSARPSAADEQRLRERLRRMLERSLEDALGREAVAEAAEGDLRARCAIDGLDFTKPPVSSVRTTAFQSPTGRVGFVLELEDAAANTPLLRFAERRPLPGGTFVGPPWTELQRTREAFRRFLLDARAAIAELGVARGG